MWKNLQKSLEQAQKSGRKCANISFHQEHDRDQDQELRRGKFTDSEPEALHPTLEAH